MLPLTTVSSYFWMQTAEYMREEWQQLLECHVESVDDGWKGIFMLNLAWLVVESATGLFFFCIGYFPGNVAGNG